MIADRHDSENNVASEVLVACGSQAVDNLFVPYAGETFLLTLRKQIQNASCVDM